MRPSLQLAPCACHMYRRALRPACRCTCVPTTLYQSQWHDDSSMHHNCACMSLSTQSNWKHQEKHEAASPEKSSYLFHSSEDPEHHATALKPVKLDHTRLLLTLIVLGSWEEPREHHLVSMLSTCSIWGLGFHRKPLILAPLKALFCLNATPMLCKLCGAHVHAPMLLLGHMGTIAMNASPHHN